MNASISFLFFGASIGIIILFAIFRLRQAGRNHERRRDAARKLGLEFTHGGE